MDMKDTLLAVSGLLGGSGGGGGSGGPLITQQPSDVSDEIGVTVHFSVTASGTGLTYMWQSNFYNEWRDTSFSSSTTATLALKVSQERDGVQYRCKITDGEGHVVYSHPATLRVAVPEPVFITKTITENGTYAASSDNADGYSEVTVNVPAGLVLLASGEYTKVSGANLTIPVSFSGTAKVLFVCNASTEFTAAQFGAAVRVYNSVVDPNNADLPTWFPAGPGAYAYRSVKSDGTKGYVINQSDSPLALNSNNTALTCNRISSNTYPFLNTQYKWYIYGEVSA